MSLTLVPECDMAMQLRNLMPRIIPSGENSSEQLYNLRMVSFCNKPIGPCDLLIFIKLSLYMMSTERQRDETHRTEKTRMRDRQQERSRRRRRQRVKNIPVDHQKKNYCEFG